MEAPVLGAPMRATNSEQHPVADKNGKANIDEISTPSDLKFDDNFESSKYASKVKRMEEALIDPHTTLTKWQEFAKSDGGLVNDNIRKSVWPILGGVTKDEIIDAPLLTALCEHSEYNQVKLDVDRSLKRFPPGIPYNKRVELQDQLTVLILRVIIKYPHLKYYQGYHDIAITLLLVCGEKSSFPLLCRISHGDMAPLAPFMQDTMEPTQHRLNYIYPLIKNENDKLASFLRRAGVGTMFALPWYLTWFGHSLNRYTDVVRLYDYFLCSPPMFPLYVTVAIVLHRSVDIFDLDCDMATLHCFLSQLPEDLPFEDILKYASKLYSAYLPKKMEPLVLLFEKHEEQLRKEEEERTRRMQIARRGGDSTSFWNLKLRQLRRVINENPLLQVVPPRYRALMAATTMLVGVYAYIKFDYPLFGTLR